MKKASLFAVLSFAIMASVAAAAEWQIDVMHSNVGFSVKHMMISTVHGNFGKYAAKVVFDDAKPENSTFEATIDASSINTGVEMRDKHLKSPDFFDVEKYPSISFKSTKVIALGEGKLKVLGDLTIHGVAKSVTLEGEGFSPVIKNMQGGLSAAATASTTINRKDFGLVWNRNLDNGNMVVDENVKITLELELVKK